MRTVAERTARSRPAMRLIQPSGTRGSAGGWARAIPPGARGLPGPSGGRSGQLGEPPQEPDCFKPNTIDIADRQHRAYSLSHMTLHFCYDLIVLGLYSSGSSI